MSESREPLIIVASFALLMLVACAPQTSEAPLRNTYGEDRALIEDLQARYIFAMDFHDPQSYAGTFTEDGVLDYGGGQIKGRQAIHDMVARTRDRAATQQPGSGPPKGRHSITNMAIKVTGDKATAVAYWFLMTHESSAGKVRQVQLDSFGHYEDDLVKVNGQWLFSLRKIYNEEMPAWAWTGDGNPAVTPGAGPGKGLSVQEAAQAQQ